MSCNLDFIAALSSSATACVISDFGVELSNISTGVRCSASGSRFFITAEQRSLTDGILQQEISPYPSPCMPALHHALSSKTFAAISTAAYVTVFSKPPRDVWLEI
ncbi:hypothetical protein SRHO_G00105180 [Serrasalmus rhombeus]